MERQEAIKQMKIMIYEDGLKEHFFQDDHDTTVYALMTLFLKHPELVTGNKSDVLSDLITHASSVTVGAHIIKKPYAHAQKTIKSSAGFAEK